MGRVLSGASLTFLIMASLTFSTAVAQVGVSYDVDVAVELLDEDFYAGVDKNGSGPADGARIAFGGSSSNDGQRIAFISADLGEIIVQIIEPEFVLVADAVGIDPETWDANANGTPDIQEIRCFTLLEATQGLPALVRDAFDENLVRAQGDLASAGALAESFAELFAFYMTISNGADGSSLFVETLCAFFVGCDFSGASYNTSQSVDAVAALNECDPITSPTRIIPQGSTAIFVVDTVDPSSWRRVTQDGEVNLFGSISWTPDDEYVFRNGFRFNVDTGLGGGDVFFPISLELPPTGPNGPIEASLFGVAGFLALDPFTLDFNEVRGPDLFEFRCLEQAFLSYTFPSVQAAFDANVLIAEDDLGSLIVSVNPDISKFVATYMTLGDAGSINYIINSFFPTPIIADNGGVFQRTFVYDTSQSAAVLAAIQPCLDAGPEIAFEVVTADNISITRLPADNFGVARWTNVSSPQQFEVISAGAILADGTANFDPPGFVMVIVALDLPDGSAITDPHISGDGTLLSFGVIAFSNQADPLLPGFVPDINDLYVLTGVDTIIAGGANEDLVALNGVFSLADPRLIPIRTLASDPTSQLNKAFGRISEDNSLMVYAEDFGDDGTGSKFTAVNPDTILISDFDVMLSKADGSPIESANDGDDLRFANPSANEAITDITPGGLRVVAQTWPVGTADLHLFLFTFTVSTDFSAEVDPLPAGETVIDGETVILTDSAVEVPIGDPIVIEDPSGTEVLLPPGQVINFPEGTESSEITIFTPVDPVTEAELPPGSPVNAIPILRAFEPAGTEFFPPIEITIVYTDAEVADILDENLLQPFLFRITDPATGAGVFEPVPLADITFRDPANNVIKFLVDHFSIYGIGGVANTEPTAVCQDVTLALDAAGVATVTTADVNDGSFDPDSDPITLSLEGNTEFTIADVGTPQKVTLVVEDDRGGISRCLAIVTVEVDRTPSDTTPPVITLVEGDVTLECSEVYTESGATASDNVDGDISGSIVIDASAVISTTPGTYAVTYNVSDNAGNAAVEVTRTVTVEDTTPPTITSSFASPDVMWPPNHKMIEVVCNIVASDACDSDAPTIELISVTSNESDNGFGLGDGNTSNDIQVDMSTTPPTIKLRSERAGKGDGRIYTLTFSVTDAEGNSTEAVCTVEVPKNASAHTCDNPDCDLNGS